MEMIYIFLIPDEDERMLLTPAVPPPLPLQMINAVTDIQEDTVVEVVISAQSLGEDDVEIRPHQLSIHSYKSPTFCHFCGEMLFGMFKQVRRTGLFSAVRLLHSIGQVFSSN